LANKHLFENKVVLDVGCGTSILSMFCADAGARTVFAVDASDMADYALQIVERNKLGHVIKVIKGKMEELELPEKVDIIVSEWMGYFLVYESMLDSVIYARDRWLNPGGLMFPSHARILFAPITFSEYYEDHVLFWESVYGKDFSPLIELAKKSSLGEVQVESLSVENDMSLQPAVIKHFDCAIVTKEDLRTWRSNFSFISTIFAPCHGFAAWFEVDFDAPKPFLLNTGPASEPTHWGQTLFFFDDPLSVKQDDKFEGEIKVSINPRNHRFIDVELSCDFTPVDGNKMTRLKKFTIQ
jgi:protein arginine N-methyltransferase 6